MQSIKILKPVTLFIRFTKSNPATFTITGERNGLYYFKNLKGQRNRIKFNIPDSDFYKSNHDFEIVKITEIELPQNLPNLPEYEREDIKDFVIVDNPDLTNSPARVFVKDGRVERGRTFYDYPKPVRSFILLHEIGHFFYGITEKNIEYAKSLGGDKGKKWLTEKMYDSEKKCDLFALIQFLNMGYNRSTAFYSLSKVLSRKQENIDRVKHLINNIQKTQKNALFS